MSTEIVLAELASLEPTGARSVLIEVAGRPRPLDVVLVRDRAAVRAYLNRCPHRGTPLETFADELLDRSTGDLVCSTHGARFRPDDGTCVSGPCLGARLEALAVRVVDGLIVLAEPPERWPAA